MISSDENQFRFQPIGHIESCYKDRFAVPRQPGLVPSSKAFLKINKDLQPEQSLAGLEGFSHLWIVFVFHANHISRFHAKVHPPRLEGESMGLFATRTPHRPNPIGLSLVQLDRIEKDTVHISGVDLMDGTPVLDIKPYLKEVESVPEAREGWTTGRRDTALFVEFTAEAESELASWQRRCPTSSLREIITQTLQLDPRPKVYKTELEDLAKYKNTHAFRLYDGDIHFRFLSADIVQVFKILS
jgi:tRNA-Thr(GGU) m(6)t(6)A37 methyltransferase TsaA